MKFGYVMKEGKPVRILHGSVAVTYDSFGGRHEHPVSFIEADSWEEAVNKIKDVGNSDMLGNMAKMREALVALNSINIGGLKRLLCELVEADIFDGGLINKTISAVEKARRALAAPARNCDMFGGDYKMLHTAWFDWTGSPDGHNDDGTVKMPFGEWLLAKARGCK